MFKPLKKLNNNHMRCMDMLLYTNKSNIEIAKELGVNPTTMGHWCKDPLFIAKLQELTRQKYAALTKDAYAEIYNIAMTSKSDSIRLAACKDILDRGGMQAVNKTEISTPEDNSIEINIGFQEDGNGNT